MRIARQLVAAAAGYFGLLLLLAQHPSPAAATRNAHVLRAVEMPVGLASLEAWFRAHDVFAPVGSLLYVGLHFGVTAGVVVWLIVCRPDVWRTAASLLVVLFALAALLFWLLPVAPPWMLGGPDGTPWAHPATAVSGLDVYGSFPSLHVACAAWVAGVLQFVTRRRVWQLYPLFVSVVVVATGNHYVLDCVAGDLLAGVSALLVGVWVKGRTRRQTRGEVLVPGYGC